MERDSSLVSAELERRQQEALYEQLVMQTMGGLQNRGADSRVIKPEPGFCVKTFSVPDKQKVFVNICQSPAIPPPPHLSKQELLDLLQSDDPTGYKVPMSLGEPHAELDNNSQGCTAYDVVINSEFLEKCQREQLFLQFVVAVSLEGLENKYSLELSREWKMLKNRKFLGSVNNQNIRTQSKPIIRELSPGEQLAAPPAAQRPEFCLLVEPPAGEPEHLIAEIQLPGVRSSRSLVLDLGEDRLVLTARPSLFHLDCFFPLCVDPEKSSAQFNVTTEVLTVTMRVTRL
ncbi:PIH1 domain-containing protein 1 [Scleropages formosus]|uniref:PIH1 domain-containing protein 1 n=1 Tax=Scleropages formosus TaxID=113540 RepID=A0A8C9V097_SCLFO|nr:PIH1 domain-containing protein 1 [Scleropages formosus]XP_029109756.1 PIH1 domain-containing protein 1 [Scleropages formosus]XP_029109757.1 PIH1 domain-containing protein 1 [Scleropages formosus]XP_029109758.1 PIH1 domain-containing protein 1 [Scleropages formosus]